MPTMRNYLVDVELTARIRDAATGRIISAVTLTDEAKANSFEPEKMINPVVHNTIETLGQKIWDHGVVVTNHEYKRN